MGTRPSLNEQLNRLLQKGFDEGASKRSYRGQTKSMKNDKIFSYKNYDSIKAISKNLVKFLKDNYPEIRYVKEIKKEHIESYLNFKSHTCNDKTLTKIKQCLDTICLLGKRYYSRNMDWNVTVPTSQKAYNKAQTKFGKAMPQKDFELITETLLQNKDIGKNFEYYLLVKFAYATSMRVDEIAYQDIMDIKLKPIGEWKLDKQKYGAFGYGTITVTNPKHGRPRTIDILNYDDYLIIDELVERAKQRGSTKITDIPYSTLTSWLSKFKKEYEIDCPLAGWHGIRKLSIDNYYQMIRQSHDKRTTIGMTNLRLGHGFDRGVSALKTYVQNIW